MRPENLSKQLSALGVEKSVDEWKAAVRAAARINRIGAAAANNAYTKTNNYAKLSVILEKFKALKQAAHQYEVDVDQCVKLFDEAWEAYCQIPLKRADYVLTLQPQFVELVSLLKSEEARKIYLDKLNLVKSTSDLNLDSVMLYVALQPESGVFLAKLLSVLNQSSEALEAQAKPNLSANNVDTAATRKKLEFLKATLASQSVLYKAISNFTIIIGKESVDALLDELMKIENQFLEDPNPKTAADGYFNFLTQYIIVNENLELAKPFSTYVQTQLQALVEHFAQRPGLSAGSQLSA